MRGLLANKRKLSIPVRSRNTIKTFLIFIEVDLNGELILMKVTYLFEIS